MALFPLQKNPITKNNIISYYRKIIFSHSVFSRFNNTHYQKGQAEKQVQERPPTETSENSFI